MADTLERSLESVLNQIDERFEVLVIDDGSSDSSVSVLEELTKRHPNLRIKPLKRDRKRLLGETRNISIREAAGEYVLPQFDCDDVYDICIPDFVEIFHQIESCYKKDIYLKGNKLNIGRRDFLLGLGPYRNVFKEDRDMWIRLASIDAILFMSHMPVHKRLPKTLALKIKRLLFKTWAHIQADYRSGMPFLDPLKMLFSRNSSRPYKVRILRCLYSPLAWITAKFMSPLPLPDGMKNGKFKEYWKNNEDSFIGILEKKGCKPDLSRLSHRGIEVFVDF